MRFQLVCDNIIPIHIVHIILNYNIKKGKIKINENAFRTLQ